LGENETRTEWHRVYAWGNPTSVVETFLKGQLVSLEGKIMYRVVEEDVEGNQKRWALKFNDAKNISQIDAVFVTVESGGGARTHAGDHFCSPTFTLIQIILKTWSIEFRRFAYKNRRQRATQTQAPHQSKQMNQLMTKQY
jgi:single-stranded DNA-binding protein